MRRGEVISSRRWRRAARGALVVVAAGCAGAIAAPNPAFAGRPTAPRIAFWVSPRGGARATGTRSSPFGSLARARDAVRGARRAHPSARITVYLLGGVYRLPAPLVLDARDSGRPGNDVVWTAAPGARPVISGAVRVRGWTLHDARRGIYVARVPRGLVARELWVDGRRAVRARTALYPNGFKRTSAGYRSPNAAMASWPDASGMEAVTLTQWKMMRCPVAAVRGREVIMRQPCWHNVNVWPPLWAFNLLGWLENAYELLHSPGQWYLDSRHGRLFYIPLPGQRLAKADVELPATQALVDLRGTLARPVSDLRFQGIRFEYATWLGPSGPNGYAEDQSGFYLAGYGHSPKLDKIGHDPNTVPTPGDVSVSYGRAITFTHDDFFHLGAVGLEFGTGSQDNSITANRFDDTSSAAIQIGGTSLTDAHPSHPGQVTRDNLIAENLITSTGREYEDAAGIMIGFTTRSKVEHNDIGDVPWSGIAVGWGWGLLDPGGFPGVPGARPGYWGSFGQPTTSRGNQILDNRIHGFLQVLWDGGAIYSLGRQGVDASDGELVAGNVATGKRRLAGGNVLYTDGGSRYVTLEHNVSLGNPPGVTDFGPCGLTDSLALCAGHASYGTDRGGCRPYGYLDYVQNYWQHPALFLSACPFAPYPVHVTERGNQVVSGPSQVPRAILDSAGIEPGHRASVGTG